MPAYQQLIDEEDSAPFNPSARWEAVDRLDPPLAFVAPTLSQRLAFEMARQLEKRGEFKLAAGVLSHALAEEALRVNRQINGKLDLMLDPDAPFHSKSIADMLSSQHTLLEALHSPAFAPPPHPATRSTCRALARCSACLSCRPTSQLPSPDKPLRELAERWRIEERQVQALWADFLRLSGGSLSLSKARAKASFLGDVSELMRQAVWDVAVLDPDAASSGFMDFEEFLIFRSFASAPCLEVQFRFLWALYDRDQSGHLTAEDLYHVWQIHKVSLGWDEEYTQGWVDHARRAVYTGRREPSNRGISPDELRKALMQRADLRPLFMAKEPNNLGGTKRGVV